MKLYWTMLSILAGGVLAFFSASAYQLHAQQTEAQIAQGTAALATTGSIGCYSVMGTSGQVSQVCNSTRGQDWNWLPLETRKDNGRGLTRAALRGTRHPLAEEDVPPPGYVEKAEQAGIDTDEVRALSAIHDADLHIFDYKRVDDYLYRQALKMGARHRWVWKPVGQPGIHAMMSAAQYQDTPIGILYPQAYSRRIPLRVLETMERIKQCLPGAAFLVSDFAAIRPDPFLAVTTKSLLERNELWIIDMWDEPGFTEK